jgi:hypothetical protein
MHSFNTCYKQALKKQSKLKGKIVFRLVVDPAGQVINVHLDKGGNSAKAFETCMIQNLKKLHFPAAKSGVNTVIIVSFVLK